jgi:bifunctional UDP-N-acetylglucosamine pyrophosphorylase / glucosamine-1-phosphate N-acetyltransferase
MGRRTCLTVILAAGEGTRMRSATPKVLHAVANRSLVGHVLHTALGAGADKLAVVVGPDHANVEREALRIAPGAAVFRQMERRGTAHAVLSAREALQDRHDDVLVLFGDTPLVRPETLARLREALHGGAAVAVLGFNAVDPAGYGRLLVDNGELVAIREHKDASEGERAVTFCNAGIMGIAGAQALELLEAVGCENAAKEFYLTDIVGLARAKGLKTVALEADEEEVQGVNNRVQLSVVEAAIQKRLRIAAMEQGATLHDPASVYFSADTQLGRDVIIEPHVVFGPDVRVKDGVTIHAFCHLEGAVVGHNASVGPYARLRPGTRLEEKAKIGNFVEVKNACFGRGAKANHLSYIGDASVGDGANIGAGTITCNYDGTNKHKTQIGTGAFVGSNSSLVAPVTIGAGAYIGSGSVITKDIPDNALAVARGRQIMKADWAVKKNETLCN